MSSLEFRSSEIPAGNGVGDFAAAHGHAAVNPALEMQLSHPTDVGRAHAFFQPTMDASAHAALGHAAIGHAAIAPAGAESLLSVIPGANEPISPLIQMIMRMPGHIGLLNALFDAIGAFLFPHFQELMHFLQPAILDLHAHVSHAANSVHIGGMQPSGAEHFAIDPAILPHDAPFFQANGLGQGTMAGGLSRDLISKMRSSEPFERMFRNPLKVSSDGGFSKVQYETGHGQLLSGPAMSDAQAANHLAGNHRLFSDCVPGTFFTKASALKPTLGGQSAAQAAGTNSGVTPSPLQVNGSPYGSTDASAAGYGDHAITQATNQVKDTTVAAQSAASSPIESRNSSSFGPSGQVGDRLSDRQLIASKGENVLPPNLGGQGGDYGANYLQTQPSHLPTQMPGLKAKALSLDGTSGNSVAHADHALKQTADTGHQAGVAHAKQHNAIDQVGHQYNGAHAHHDYAAMDQIGHQYSGAHAHHDHATMDHVGHQAQAHSHHDRAVMDQIAHQGSPARAFSSHKFEKHSVESRVEPNTVSQSQPGQFEYGSGAAQSQNVGSSQTVANGQDPYASVQNPQVPSANTSQDPYGAAQNSGSTGTSGQQASDASLKTTDGGDAVPDASYTIRAGDCLWNIARDHLGSGLKWREIYNANQDVLGANPDMVFPGTNLKLPGDVGQNLEMTKYVVKPGDNLWDISRHTMGDGTKWGEIYKANAAVVGANPRLIHPGQQLNIPGAENGTAVANAGSASVGAAPDAGASAVGSTAQNVGAPQGADMSKFGQPGTESGAASSTMPAVDAGGAHGASPAAGAQTSMQSDVQSAPHIAETYVAPGAAQAANLHLDPLPSAQPLTSNQWTAVPPQATANSLAGSNLSPLAQPGATPLVQGTTPQPNAALSEAQVMTTTQSQMALPQKDIPATVSGDTSPVSSSMATDISSFLGGTKKK